VEVEHSPIRCVVNGAWRALSRVEQSARRRGASRRPPITGSDWPDDKIAFSSTTRSWSRLSISIKSMSLNRVFDRLTTRNFSETNFYDALLETLNRMKGVRGRKAIILISSASTPSARPTSRKSCRRSGLRDPHLCDWPGFLHAVGGRVYGEAAPLRASIGLAPKRNWKCWRMLREGVPTRLSPPRRFQESMTTSWKTSACGMWLPTYHRILQCPTSAECSGELVDPTTGKPLKIRDLLERLFLQAFLFNNL